MMFDLGNATMEQQWMTILITAHVLLNQWTLTEEEETHISYPYMTIHKSLTKWNMNVAQCRR